MRSSASRQEYLIKVFLPHILSSSRTSIVGSKNQLHAVLFGPAGNNPQDQIRWRCFLAQNVLERDKRVSIDSLECGNTTLPAGKCETKIRAFRTTNVWLIDAVWISVEYGAPIPLICLADEVPRLCHTNFDVSSGWEETHRLDGICSLPSVDNAF